MGGCGAATIAQCGAVVPHRITMFYYETINQGTWGDIKVFFTKGELGQPDTIRHNVIEYKYGIKTYGLDYPSK